MQRDSSPREQVLALGALPFSKRNGEKKECVYKYICLYICMRIYMYVIMLSHGETKWISYSLDILKFGFM